MIWPAPHAVQNRFAVITPPGLLICFAATRVLMNQKSSQQFKNNNKEKRSPQIPEVCRSGMTKYEALVEMHSICISRMVSGENDSTSSEIIFLKNTAEEKHGL